MSGTLQRVRQAWRSSVAALLIAIAASPALAHKPSDSYLSLQVGADGLSGRWDIALRDLDHAIGLDADGNGEITWGELRQRHQAIAAHALARLAIAADGQACAISAGEQLVDDHSDGAYTVVPLQIDCPVAAPRQLSIDYRLFAELDPQHRGLLRLDVGDVSRSAIFSPQAASQQFELADQGRIAQFLTFVGDGVWHIWIGFDHILFLLSLLLPAVLLWQGGRWQPVDRLRPAAIDVVKIVTAFTAAHSITLSLATLGVVVLPSRWVEAVIAASVVLAALNNVWPLVQRRRWLVAFIFGLIHGFGFASVLADLGLPQASLLLALVGFNVGVELGQLAIVVLFLPLAYWLRGTGFYRRGVLVGGSLLIALLAAAWFAERAFRLELLPF
ncbi:HupE/UreJ family protein [Piscinibacter sakaiensis]|uniref:HupE/UreJ family protein n=1 Tax=Piscinibacter sakaiensis TaxID=1547922 RepID=UPI003AAE6E93